MKAHCCTTTLRWLALLCRSEESDRPILRSWDGKPVVGGNGNGANIDNNKTFDKWIFLLPWMSLTKYSLLQHNVLPRGVCSRLASRWWHIVPGLWTLWKRSIQPRTALRGNQPINQKGGGPETTRICIFEPAGHPWRNFTWHSQWLCATPPTPSTHPPVTL